MPEPARGEAAAARPMAAAETARVDTASPRAPATDTATVAETAPADTAPRQPPRTLASVDAAPAPRDRPALRGTLPAPLVTPRQTQGAEPIGSPELARAAGDGVRLRPSLPGEPATARAGADAVASQAAPPAERRAARLPQEAPVAPPPAPPMRAAEATPRQLAAVAPATPERLAAGRGDPVDRFTSAYQGGECFFPVRVASEEGLAVRGYGLQAESIDMFRQAFAQALGTDPDVEWRPLTDAQCGGISFTRIVLGGSAPSVHIGLASKRLDWGQELAGRVAGSRADFVTLLIVDDSGVVHNVLDYLRRDGGELAFSVPVHPVDDGADRVQLIMAVGASEPLALLESTTPMHSDDYFAELLHQADEAGATLELGLEDFVILDGSS